MEALSFSESSPTIYHSKGHNNKDTWNFINTAAENQRPRHVGVHCITEEPYHSVADHISGQPHYPEYHKLSFLHHHENLKFHVDFPCHTSRYHQILSKLLTTKTL